MKCFIVDSFVGFFAYDEELNVVLSRVFENTEDAIAQMLALQKRGTCTEVEVLIHDLIDRGYDSFVFEDEMEARALKAKYAISFQVSQPSEGGQAFRANQDKAAAAAGIKPDRLAKTLKDVSEAIVRVQIRTAAEKRDRLVAEAVSGLDEIDKNVNITVSRVREWYGLHFPELDTLVPDHRHYMAMVAKYGMKVSFDYEGVNAIIQNEVKAKAISDAAHMSMGADISDSDMRQIVNLAESNLKTYALRDTVEKYIDETMKEVAPNMRELAGACLGARLIALAGSLENCEEARQHDTEVRAPRRRSSGRLRLAPGHPSTASYSSTNTFTAQSAGNAARWLGRWQGSCRLRQGWMHTMAPMWQTA